MKEYNNTDPVATVYECRNGHLETDKEIAARVRRDRIDIFGRPIEDLTSMTAEEIVRAVVNKYTTRKNYISLMRSCGGGIFKIYDRAIMPARGRTTYRPADGEKIFSLDKVAEEIELRLYENCADNANVPNIGMSCLEDFLRAGDFRTVKQVRRQEREERYKSAIDDFIAFRDEELKRIAREIYSTDSPAEIFASESLAKDAVQSLCGASVQSSVDMLASRDAEIKSQREEIETLRKRLALLESGQSVNQKSVNL